MSTGELPALKLSVDLCTLRNIVQHSFPSEILTKKVQLKSQGGKSTTTQGPNFSEPFVAQDMSSDCHTLCSGGWLSSYLVAMHLHAWTATQ